MRVDIKRLCKNWKGFSLKDISLGIGAGKYFALLGPCGSGKTLLLSTIAGIYRPDSGNILIDGKDITFTPPENRNIGYLFQGAFLFPHMSVKENIYYGLRYRETDGEYIKLIFKLLNIEAKLLSRRDVVNLSGGEARKIALARSIVTKPRLLLLDEPLAFLDPINQQAVLKSLKALNKNLGLTIIHVTHTSSEIRDLADKIAILADGSVLQTGSPPDILDKPHDTALERYWGRISV